MHNRLRSLITSFCLSKFVFIKDKNEKEKIENVFVCVNIEY